MCQQQQLLLNDYICAFILSEGWLFVIDNYIDLRNQYYSCKQQS